MVIVLGALAIYQYGEGYYKPGNISGLNENLKGQWDCQFYRGASGGKANIKINFEDDIKYTSTFSITVYGNNDSGNQIYILDEYGKYSLDKDELILNQGGCEFEKVSYNKDDAVYRALLSRCEEPTVDKFKILDFTDSQLSMTQNFTEKYQCRKIN
ncbi:hypothetical protein F0237_10095 [Vibrio tubiashii]|uniref:Uncharacterized protein n=1 Tax=Vibrio tubiashii TaxID=29498 RepID=A0AAE5GQ76_9VIBR|nr:hypothetical protein [Vibrio tubiashii]NOI81013.1 hypothetical protein [Vibrio tubiashii]